MNCYKRCYSQKLSSMPTAYFPARVCYHCNRSRECLSQPQLHTMKCYNDEDSCGKIVFKATDHAVRGCTAMKPDGCQPGSPTLESRIIKSHMKRNLSSPFKRENEDYIMCVCNKDYCNAQEPTTLPRAFLLLVPTFLNVFFVLNLLS